MISIFRTRRLALASLIFVSAFSVCVQANEDRLNVVFFLIDDLGWTDFGCYGSEYYETPRIDAFCAKSMKFTSAYSSGPNCAPTRACLMSGQYTPRHGIYTVTSGARGKAKNRKLVPAPNKTALSPKIHTLGEAFRSAGYATAHLGKWHLGKPDVGGPKEQGFDLNAGGDQKGHPPTYFSPYRNKYLSNGPKGEYLTDRLTDEALAFIDSAVERKKPFFLYFSHFTVHTPIQAKRDVEAKYAERKPAGGHSNAAYAAMVESVDDSVGRVLDKLAAKGLSERTLIVLTSDNGGVGGYVRLGLKNRDITDNAPLRGGKGMLYEGGVRVPLIVSWPGVTKARSVCDVPVTSVDFYPTLAEISKLALPKKQPLDGVSFASLLRGAPASDWKRDAIFWHFPGYLQANSNLGTWRTTPAGAIRSGDLKLIEFFEDDRVELYDLSKDIGETTDLAASRPEEVKRLLGALRGWRRRVSAPMPSRK